MSILTEAGPGVFTFGGPAWCQRGRQSNHIWWQKKNPSGGGMRRPLYWGRSWKSPDGPWSFQVVK